MTVQELIDVLQTLPKDKVMHALDTNGDWTTDLSIWHYADRVEILGIPDDKEWAKKHKRFITLNTLNIKVVNEVVNNV